MIFVSIFCIWKANNGASTIFPTIFRYPLTKTFFVFSMLSAKDGLVHTFSRVYLYTFVMLFIYVVLSLFIAIIMDTYEKIKSYYEEGFPQSRIDQFYKAKEYDPYSTEFYDGSNAGLVYLGWSWVMASIYGRRWRGYNRMLDDNRKQQQVCSL